MKLAKFIPEIKIIPNNIPIQNPKVGMKFKWENYSEIRIIINIDINGLITDEALDWPFYNGKWGYINDFLEEQRKGKIKIIK